MTESPALERPLPHASAVPALTAHRSARRRRATTVTAALGAGCLALFVLTMTIGSYGVSPWDVLSSALHLKDNPSVDFVVRELRLPTALTGLGVGLALGLAGLVFQKLLANPLASPDFVGVSSGASLFAVVSITLLNLGNAGISLAALLGALTSAALVYVLAWRDGISGYRFILIGIGISEFMLAIVGYVVAKADLPDARAAMTWLVGSVGHASSGQVTAVLVTVALCVPAALVLARPLRALELGDAAATALGARVEACRLALFAVSIVLVAAATAAAGPLVFVALVAGPIAGRLLGSGSRGLLPAALVGAIIVLASDLVAEHLLPVALPTGVVTGAVGAPYLIWLLATANRDGRRMIGRTPHELRADGLTLGYAGPDVVTNLDVVVPDGRITMIVAANACGKSTLLRGLARLLRPRNGAVLLDGVSLGDMRSVDVARTLGLLPQTPVAPDGITVGDLVARGRYPHQGWFRRWSTSDAGAVAEALEATGIADLVDRDIDELSGGQRQRVWVAMALAQDTDLLLLDEPTTFLDISHQVDLLDLLTDLNRNAGRTIVIVLHDLNLACRYGDHLIAMKNGTILAQGSPREVVTAELVADVFGLACEIVPDPVSGTPLVVPRGRHHPGPTGCNGTGARGAGRLAAVPPRRRTEKLVLEEGTAAPDFSLVSDSGETVNLSDFRGRPVVLYFYPKDDTPGCTKQACGLRDAYAEYEERGAVILGVSPDDEGSHASFKTKHGLPFTLLADPDRTVAQTYDVWREKTSYGKKSMGIVRSTFVIDGDGTIVRALYGVKPDGHAEKVLASLPT